MGLRDLDDLSEALANATAAYANACNETAIAENTYLKAFHTAWIENAGRTPASIRSKDADNHGEVVDAKCTLNLKEAVERSAKAKVEELRNRLMAAMSYQKYLGANG